MLNMKELWHKMDNVYDLYAKTAGTNFTTLLILQMLDLPEVYTQKRVCEELGLPKQLVNSIIKALWLQKFVELKEATDRRNKDIIVTTAGKEYIRKILDPLEAAELKAWEDFSAEEIAAYANATEKYTKSLEVALKNTTAQKPPLL